MCDRPEFIVVFIYVQIKHKNQHSSKLINNNFHCEIHVCMTNVKTISVGDYRSCTVTFYTSYFCFVQSEINTDFNNTIWPYPFS